MNLKDITLKEVSPRRYNEFNLDWYKKRERLDYVNPCEIVKPISFKDYQTLLEDFMESKSAHKVSYFNEGWCKVKLNKLTTTKIAEIVDAVKNDRKICGLELTFDPKKSQDYRDRVKIRFNKNGDVVVGFDLYSSVEFREHFTWEEPPKSKERLEALLDPNYIKQL